MTDADLIHRCQTGDQAAWTQLFHAYKDRILKLACLVTRDQQDAHDVTQETFLRLIKRIRTFDETRASFDTWLYAIVMNLARDHLRRKKRLPLAWDQSIHGELIGPLAMQPENLSLNHEWQRTIWHAVNALKEKQRMVVVLRYYLDLSCAEIADVLGCAEGTVHSRLHYARLALEQELGEHVNELVWAPA